MPIAGIIANLLYYSCAQANNSVSSIQPTPVVTEDNYTEVDRIETFPCDAYHLNSREAEDKQVSRQSKP